MFVLNSMSNTAATGNIMSSAILEPQDRIWCPAVCLKGLNQYSVEVLVDWSVCRYLIPVNVPPLLFLNLHMASKAYVEAQQPKAYVQQSW